MTQSPPPPTAPAVASVPAAPRVPDIFAFGKDVPTVLFKDPADGGDGSYCLNRDKLLTGWRWRAAKLNGVFPVTQGATDSGQELVVVFEPQGGAGGVGLGDQEISHFWCKLTAGTDRIAVKPIMGRPIDRELSNVKISHNLVFGTSQLPGFLPSSLYGWTNSEIRFQTTQLTGATTIRMGTFGRVFMEETPELEAVRRAANTLQGVHPYWCGPFTQGAPELSGPEVSLAAGATVDIRFPSITEADFLARWILDDSTSTSGLEPKLKVWLHEEGSQASMVDFPQGLDWRNFLAIPTVTVTGFPNGGVIRAMSLKSRRRGRTHLIHRGSALVARVVSNDTGTVTFRACLLGWMLRKGEGKA